MEVVKTETSSRPSKYAKSETKHARQKIGKKLASLIEEYGIDIKQMAAVTGFDLITLSNLAVSAPQMRTIECVVCYVEGKIREKKSKQLKRKPKF